ETVDSDEPSKRERWLKWVWHCINAYKVAHLNTFYMHPDVCPYSDELLDAFDEAGMLVLSFPFAPYANYEDATWDIERAPVPLRDLQRQAMELFLRDWNHPCIIIYAFDGEGMDCYLREGNLEAYRRAQRYFRQFMHFVRRANPSRIHSDSCGDRNFTGLSQVYDEHFYAGYYHSSVPDFVNRCIPRYYFKRESHNRKIPIIFSEMCGCYTHSGRKGGFSNELVASSWVGTFASNPIVARVYQAWNYKHTIEGCRRLQVDGIFPFAYCVGFYGPRGTYSDPAPAAICVRIAMEPVLVSFGTFDQRFYDGDICEFPIWVVNDTNARIHNARLRWSIESANGEVIKRGEKVLDIAPCSSECVLRVKWRIQLHEARSSHQKRNIANRIAVPSWMHRTPHSVSEGEWKPIIHVVRAELVNENGEVLSFNSHPFLIYTRERDTVEQHNVRVWLYDPVGDTEAVLRKLGIRFKRYAGGNLRNADLLIIGANGSNDGLTEHAHEIRHFAESDAGGVVLILEHSDLERLSWLTNARRNPFANFTGIVPDTVGYFRYNFAHIVRRGHLIFNGLGEWDFNLWNGFNGTIHAGDGMLNAIDMSMEGWDVLAVTSLETGACLVEKVGWIYSQFLAIERFGKDPIATRYLCNLLNYALMRAREKATWAQSVRTAEAWLKRNGHITGDHTNIELIVSHRLFWHVRRRSSAGIGKYRGIAFKFREPIRSIQFNYWFATAQQRLQLQLVSDDGRVMWQSDGDVNVGTVKLSGLNVRGFELRACHTKAILYPTFFAEVWNLHINGSTRSE
ncbi:MAG TPA: hypothetical protein EYP10_01155, partial [Armatimonadetes bacterium]|nr:hypothetical protein [Armatimonadota bacterium]